MRVAEREPADELGEPRLVTDDGGRVTALLRRRGLRDQREQLGPGLVAEQIGHDRGPVGDRREQLGALQGTPPRARQDALEGPIELAQALHGSPKLARAFRSELARGIVAAGLGIDGNRVTDNEQLHMADCSATR
jgi:hypothetical protein